MNIPTIEKTVTMPLLSFDLVQGRDEYLAQLYYNEWVDNANGECDVTRINDWLYILGDASAPMYTKSWLSKQRKAVLYELAVSLDVDYYLSDKSTKAELIEALEGYSVERFYKHTAYGWNSIEDYDFIVRGYCQGDAVKIIKLSDAPEWMDKDYLTHLFYDQPLYCRLDVVNEQTDKSYEVYLDELLNGYDWDKQAVIEGLGKVLPKDLEQYKSIIAEYLEAELDEYL